MSYQLELLMILLGCTYLMTLGHYLFHQSLFLMVMKWEIFGISDLVIYNITYYNNQVKKMRWQAFLLFLIEMVFVLVVYSKNIHGIILTNMHLGTLNPFSDVHSDLCGPFPSTSFSKFKYFLTFIDDYSKCTWVYFLNLRGKF